MKELSFEAEKFFPAKTIEFPGPPISSARLEGGSRHKIRCRDIVCMCSAEYHITSDYTCQLFLVFSDGEELKVTIQVVASTKKMRFYRLKSLCSLRWLIDTSFFHRLCALQSS